MAFAGYQGKKVVSTSQYNGRRKKPKTCLGASAQQKNQKTKKHKNKEVQLLNVLTYLLKYGLRLLGESYTLN
jgi:hypothetical protein